MNSYCGCKSWRRKVRDERQQAGPGQWQCSRQLHWTELWISYGRLGTKGGVPDREEKIRAESWPLPETPQPTASELCERCRSRTVLSIHGSNQSAVSALKSRHGLIGRLTKIEYASEFKAPESALEHQPATDGLAVLEVASSWEDSERNNSYLGTHKLKSSRLWSILVVYIKTLKRKEYICMHMYIYQIEFHDQRLRNKVQK